MRPNNCWEDYILREGNDGLEAWIPKENFIRNPYNTYRVLFGGDTEALKRHRNRLSRPREESPYTYELGYNHIVGRPTCGMSRREFSGSSLNRKKYVQVIPTTKADIIKMAYEAASKYLQAGLSVVIAKWDGERGEHISTIYEEIRVAIEQGDFQLAGGLALRLRVKVRECLRRIPYGIHVLSARSRGKIKDKATAFFRACPGRRIFCTLTFIAPVDDCTGINILNKFLTQARKVVKGLQYFWVAERQDNGNIHFHMILNKRLEVGRWNAMWVICQYNAGLIGKTKWGLEVTKSEILQAYYSDHAIGKGYKKVQQFFNPLDIRKVKSIGQLSNYLTKYITKQKADQYFGCAVWHCSRGVSRLFTRATVGPSAFAYMNSLSNVIMDKTTGEILSLPSVIRPKDCPFVMLTYVLDKSAPLRYLKRMEKVNDWVLDGFKIDRLREFNDEEYCKFFICKN